jgi:hypothetical protein
MAAPEWSVVCLDFPRTVHARDDGHRCRSPLVTCSLCLNSRVHRDPFTRQEEPCPACAEQPAAGEGG